MAGDLQATLNSETAGISNIHSWGLMLPSSSRVSPVTYHTVVAVRYPSLCRMVNGMWELGSFASGGIPTRPPADLEAIVGEIIPDLADSIEFADGLFVMTTATDHKNNLNGTGLKRDNARRLRVETIANSAGGTAQVFLDGAICLSAGHQLWGLPADQRGIEPPPEVCPRCRKTPPYQLHHQAQGSLMDASTRTNPLQKIQKIV